MERGARCIVAGALFMALASATAACGSSDKATPPPGAGGSGSGGSGSNHIPSTIPTIPVPDGGMPAPTATTTLTLGDAPDLGTVNYLPNRSSVRLYLPGVTNVRDYRVFAVEDGVTVSADADMREHVDGATIYCAGLRQRNQCTDDEILSVNYNNKLLDQTTCETPASDHRPHVPSQLMQVIEVSGIGPNTTLVVEALDRQCPFPGLYATAHKDIKIANVDIGPAMSQAVVNGVPRTLKLLPDTFPLVTEAEIRQQYGSMIVNGQGPNLPVLDPSSPAFPESPYIRIGYPAAPDDPVVLARAVVSVSPSGNSALPQDFRDGDYFDDFDDNTDQPVLLRDSDPAQMVVGGTVHVYTTKKWVLYDVNNEFSDFWVDRGQLQTVMGDPSQDSMSVQGIYPKRPVQLPTLDNEYLHITYEVQRNETNRRYENFTLCGSDEVGKTYTGETPAAAPEPHPGFMNVMTTSRTSVLGWNCLELVGRGPGYYNMPGGDIMSHSDTSVKVSVILKQTPLPTNIDEYNVLIPQFGTVYGPTQDPPFPALWERQIDGSGNISGVWLDDQQNTLQRSRFDVFVRRDRVIVYVEGEQRLCQNIAPGAITMAEGALGFWHILYHTSAEFNEIRGTDVTANPATAQHHILRNTPFGDLRSWDNMGFQENVGAPANFDASRCGAPEPHTHD